MKLIRRNVYIIAAMLCIAGAILAIAIGPGYPAHAAEPAGALEIHMVKTRLIGSRADLEGYPSPVVALVGGKGLIYATETDGVVDMLFESGPRELNDFLDKMSRMKNADTTLVVSPDADSGFAGAGVTTYHWGIRVEMKDRQGAAATASTKPGGERWDVRVEADISKAMPLEEISIPIAINAEEGGRIAELVAIHKVRRAREKPDAKPTTAGEYLTGPAVLSHAVPAATQ